MFLGTGKKSYKKAYYLAELEDAPQHIKYRYYADLNNGDVTTVGLECVTKIGEEYVSFKDIFKVSPKNLDNKPLDIKEHIELFLNILKTPSSAVVFE